MRYLRWMWVLLALGCGLVDEPQVDDHAPKPVIPDVVVEHSPIESYWKALANRVEKKIIASPQDLAKVARQLQLAGEITAKDLESLGEAFPKMRTDAKAFPDPKSAAATLRSLK